MKVSINRLEGNFLLEAKNEDGRSVLMDAAESIGGTNKGVRPMQMILMALGGCSAFDIIHILNKQKEVIDDISIDVQGEREDIKDAAAVFIEAHVTYTLKGNLDPEKVKRAAQLSMEKYCSVTKTLEPTATVTYSIILNEKKIFG